MADAEDSKSSVRKHMRVQVPPSAPQFSPTVLRFLAQVTLAVKSLARVSRHTLAELWLFFLGTLRPCAPRLICSAEIHPNPDSSQTREAENGLPAITRANAHAVGSPRGSEVWYARPSDGENHS